jgi:hypothetical protein
MGIKRIVPLVVFCVASSSPSFAQSQDARRDLTTVLVPGSTVWITDSAGREERSLIVSLAGNVVTTTAGGKTRSFPTTDVARVETRRFDSLINGALIGAGAAVASGLFLCTLTETWENCNDDVGPMLGIGAIGAGAGIAIDALIRRRVTVYEAPRGAARLFVAPVVASGERGVQVSVRF